MATVIDRIKYRCWHSVTIAASYVVGAIGAILAAVPYVIDALAAPEISDAVHKVVPSKWEDLWTIGIALIFYVSRRRSAIRPICPGGPMPPPQA